MRINRYLALKGYTTRREADELIKKKYVKINDRLAIVGDIVQANDVVSLTINQAHKKKHSYFLYFKPRGIITHSPQGQEKEIADVLKLKQNPPNFSGKNLDGRGVFPVGRLDKDSRGLIVLTNDGRIVERLLSPEHYHEKEYRVKVDKPLTDHFLKNLTQGVQIEDYRTKPAQVARLSDKEFKIVLTEGKKHQIRRMASSFGYTTTDIFRTRIMNLTAKGLKVGQFREITGIELENFLKSLGLKS